MLKFVKHDMLVSKQTTLLRTLSLSADVFVQVAYNTGRVKSVQVPRAQEIHNFTYSCIRLILICMYVYLNHM